jgi:hypothetical protein
MGDYPVKITVRGFRIEGHSGEVTDEMVEEAQREIAQAIGFALLRCAAQWVDAGTVTVETP